jgi:bacterial/archaeal transporter family-2 protein
MSNVLLLIIVAAVAGVAVSLQGQFMGTIDRLTGTLTSVFLTYGMGGLIAVLLWLGARGSLENVRQIPWYAWSAGGLGVIIVGALGYSASRLGLSQTIIIAVAAQLVTAVLIDHFGLFAASARPLDAARLAGVALTIGGAWLVVRG